MMEDTRIRRLNDRQVREGKYILYWMQQSQRVSMNHALIRASYWSRKLDLPLMVYFGLTDSYPEANLRHYSFMLEGLGPLKRDLEESGVGFLMRKISPEIGAVELSDDSAITICDMGYLKHQRSWRQYVASRIKCPLEQVETDVVVPVEIAYQKEAYSAAVLRPKIKKYLFDYLKNPDEIWPDKEFKGLEREFDDDANPTRILSSLDIDRTVAVVHGLRGGEKEAKGKLDTFLGSTIEDYSEFRNDPSMNVQSDLSPYLHFGQISPVQIALRALDRGSPGTDGFLEELIVRRELAMNFTHYNDRYDAFECLPGWAIESLNSHGNDPREYLYSIEELENSETHDPYWNAAQREMVRTGKMHNYMRMYWGKKILEWKSDPEDAFHEALYLNNKYSLDGRDPNSYAGVAWCFGKHDRPWKERDIFGKVRYMNDKGLKRKFDMEPYLRRNGV